MYKSIENIKSSLGKEIYLLNSIKFFFISFFSKLFNFLVYPLLSRHYSLADFGHFDYFVALITLISSVGILGLDSMLFRFLFDKTLIQSKSELLSKSIFTQFVWLLVLLLVFLIFHFLGFLNFGKLNMAAGDILFLFLGIFGMVFYSTSELVLKISPNISKYSYLVVLNSLIFLSFTFICVNYFETSMANYIKVYSVVYFLLGFLGLYLIYSYIELKYFKLLDYKLFLYALPLCVLTLIPIAQSFFFRSIILSNLNTVNLALYGAACKLTIFFSLPALAVSNSTIPILLRCYKDSNINEIANNLSYFTLFSLSLVTIVLSIFSNELSIFMFGPTFGKSGFIFSILCLGLFVQSVIGFISIGYFVANLTIYRLVSSILSNIISIFLALMFIKLYGILGLLAGLLIGNILQFVIDVLVTKRIYKIDWEYYGILSLMFITFVIVALVQIMAINFLVLKFSFLIVIMIIYWVFYNRLVVDKKIKIPEH